MMEQGFGGGGASRQASSKYGVGGGQHATYSGDVGSRRGGGGGSALSGISGYFGSSTRSERSGRSGAAGGGAAGKGTAAAAAATAKAKAAKARRQNTGAETRPELEALPDEVLDAIVMEEHELPEHDGKEDACVPSHTHAHFLKAFHFYEFYIDSRLVLFQKPLSPPMALNRVSK